MKSLLILVASCLISASILAETSISYQGRLDRVGQPYTGTVDLQFQLFEQAVGGSQVGPTVTLNDWLVSQGLFQADLDFGAVFDGHPLWLEISADGTTLNPRQQITPAPYALALNLPLAQVANSEPGFPLVKLTQSGTGPNGWFEITNAVSTASALEGQTNGPGGAVVGINRGTGAAGWFSVENAASPTRAFHAGTTGTGSAAHFWVVNPANNAAAVYARTDGTGQVGFFHLLNATATKPAIHVQTQGTGSAAYFRVENTSNNSYAVHGWSNGSGGGVYAESTRPSGAAYAVRSHVVSATGYAGYFTGGRNYFQGDVGIAVVAPRQQLSIGAHLDLYSGNANNPTRPSIRGSSSNNLILNAVGAGALYLNHDSGTGGVYIRNGQQGDAARFFANGNFQIEGQAYKPGGGSWAVLSDERLKTDVAALEPGTLERLMSLGSYRFRYNHEGRQRRGGDGEYIGFMASEVAAVFPGWITRDDEGYLSVGEQGFAALVVEALRELKTQQSAEIAQRDTRIHALELELDQLKHGIATRLAALEAVLPATNHLGSL
jgi:hypothetical protein